MNHVGTYPTPINLNYFWSFGFLSGICLVIQIVSGIILAMHYSSHIMLAFDSVEAIMRNVNGGWFFRYVHANGASFFFIVIYLHIARALYYKSYITNPFAWISGVFIFLFLMGIAFIGYVLPWGQMSFWGATVITNLCSAIPVVGAHIVYWLWGGFAVGGATLSRFFSLHYILPILLSLLVFLHLYFLHKKGSSAPNMEFVPDKVPFYPYFILKDTFGLFVFLFFFFILVSFHPDMLGHSDNYIVANPLVTPAHIVPEWYFLPYYAMLRSVPDKLGGVIVMIASILIFLLLPKTERALGLFYRINGDNFFFSFFLLFLGVLLGWIGGLPAEEPFVQISQFATFLWFDAILRQLTTYSGFLPYFNSKDILPSPTAIEDSIKTVFAKYPRQWAVLEFLLQFSIVWALVWAYSSYAL